MSAMEETDDGHQVSREFFKQWQRALGAQETPPDLLANLTTAKDRNPEDFPHIFKEMLITDVNQRISSRGFSDVPWDEYARHAEFKNHPFEFLWLRVKSSAEALGHEWQNLNGAVGQAHPTIAAYLPQSGSPHAPFLSWFLDYLFIVQAHVATERELTTNSDELLTFCNEPEIEKRVPGYVQKLVQSRPVTAIEADFEFVRHALDRQATLAADGQTWTFDLSNSSRYKDIKVLSMRGTNGVVADCYDETMGAGENSRRIVIKFPLIRRRTRSFKVTAVVSLIAEAKRLRDWSQSVNGLAEIYEVDAPLVTNSMELEEQLARLRHHLHLRPIMITMRRYPNGTLEEFLANTDDLVAKCRTLAELAGILQEFHQQGYLHRDLKPANVLIDEQDRPILCDLGLAEEQTRIAHNEDSMKGTPLFQAPEQTRMNTYLTSRVDVWAFGVILYHTLTGRFPFDFSDRDASRRVKEIRQQIQTKEPDDPVLSAPHVDRDLSQLCLECLSKEPIGRPLFGEIVERLQVWVKKQGGSPFGRQVTKFAWNPSIYVRYTNRIPVFLLLELYSIGESTYRTVAGILEKRGCRTFRIYQVFGRYDLLIRGMFTHRELEELHRDVKDQERSVRPIRSMEELPVTRMNRHWYWGGSEELKGLITRDYDAVLLANVELGLNDLSWEVREDMRRMIDRKVVRPITETKDNIVFFVFIVQETHQPVNIDDVLLKVDQIGRVFEQQGKITHQAMYHIKHGRMFGLLKGEATVFHHIGSLVKDLNAGLSASSCITMTCVVADGHIHGSEVLHADRLAQPVTTRLVLDRFPALYDVKGCTDERLHQCVGVAVEILHESTVDYVAQTEVVIGETLMRFLSPNPTHNIMSIALSMLAEAAMAVRETLKLLDVTETDHNQQLEALEMKLGIVSKPFDEWNALLKGCSLETPDFEAAEEPEFLRKLFKFHHRLWVTANTFRSKNPALECPFDRTRSWDERREEPQRQEN